MFQKLLLLLKNIERAAVPEIEWKKAYVSMGFFERSCTKIPFSLPLYEALKIIPGSDLLSACDHTFPLQVGILEVQMV